MSARAYLHEARRPSERLGCSSGTGMWCKLLRLLQLSPARHRLVLHPWVLSPLRLTTAGTASCSAWLARRAMCFVSLHPRNAIVSAVHAVHAEKGQVQMLEQKGAGQLQGACQLDAFATCPQAKFFRVPSARKCMPFMRWYRWGLARCGGHDLDHSNVASQTE